MNKIKLKTDQYTELYAAEQAVINANKRLTKAKDKVQETKNKFREALPISDDEPCRVVQLPSGKVVVHVYVEYSDCPNQLHTVNLGYYTEDAKPRVRELTDET